MQKEKSNLSGIFLMCVLLLASFGVNTTHAHSNSKPSGNNGNQIALLAKDYLGVPYVWGGKSPRGFDCSGLVYYVHRKIGINVPRTTKEQHRKARRVQLARIKPGDLIFFTTKPRKISHVGIYLGQQRFIHAPKSGTTVAYARLDNPYWSKRFVSVGRFF